MGSENWGIVDDLGFGVRREEEMGIWVFEEAMITLAMAAVMAPRGRFGASLSADRAGDGVKKTKAKRIKSQFLATQIGEVPSGRKSCT